MTAFKPLLCTWALNCFFRCPAQNSHHRKKPQHQHNFFGLEESQRVMTDRFLQISESRWPKNPLQMYAMSAIYIKIFIYLFWKTVLNYLEILSAFYKYLTKLIKMESNLNNLLI